MSDFVKIVANISKGNPGALVAICETLKTYNNDPIKMYDFVLQFEIIRLYGSKIHIIFKDFCDFKIDLFEQVIFKNKDIIKKYVDLDDYEFEQKKNEILNGLESEAKK